jgi:hypothetical protein
MLESMFATEDDAWRCFAAAKNTDDVAGLVTYRCP